jgi:hypothetical protein
MRCIAGRLFSGGIINRVRKQVPTPERKPFCFASGEDKENIGLMTDTERCCLGFFRRRECFVPTWRGWLALFTLLALLSVAGCYSTHPFLAVNRPIPARVLVVEGWSSDDVLEVARGEFQRGGYEQLYVVGGPLEWGKPLSEYRTYAELGAATLVKMGMPTNVVQAVPAPPVVQDRTFTAARALKHWLAAHGQTPPSCNVMSVGAHARRSRLLFRKAMGDSVAVGIINVRSNDYDPARWWRSSSGFRFVTGEVIAYAYAKLVFRAPKDPNS